MPLSSPGTQTESGPAWIELRTDSDAPPSTLLTTGEVALILKVSQQTVIRAVTSGKLKGRKIPGSSHRRIAPEDLAAFLDKEKLPGVIPATEILVLGHIDALTGELRAMLEEVDEAARVRVTEDAFTAGMLVSEARPRLLVLDRSVDPEKVGALFAQLKGRDDVKLPARRSAKRGERLLWAPADQLSTRVEMADGNSEALAAVERFTRRAFGEVAGARRE